MTTDDATRRPLPLNELIPSLKPVTKPVYHYTSPEAFHPIIVNSRLWVSQASSLNDPSDVRAGWKRIRKSLTEFASDDSDLRRARDELLGFVEEPFGDGQRDVFVLSASTRRDDANQWRLYGGGGAGYCIEFDASQRLAVVASDRAPAPDLSVIWHRMHDVAAATPWLSVIYDQSQLDHYVSELVQHTAEASEPDVDGDPDDVDWGDYQEMVGEQIRDAITMLVPLVKSPAYRGEKEARIVARVGVPVQQSFRTVTGRGVISYLELGTSPDPETADRTVIPRKEEVVPLPIRSVRCGPLLYPEQDFAKEHRGTVRTFLRECFAGDGRRIRVKRSKTTLRP